MSSMVLEVLGSFVGVVLAPFVFVRSFFRGARAFHPEGIVCRAEAVAVGTSELARRLCGPVLVRLSAALHAGEAADILGIGIRFRSRDQVSASPDHGDQDVLLGTFDSFGPKRLRAAIGTTDPHDFLANDYRSVTSYRLGALGSGKLRAVGSRAAVQGGSRDARLRQAIASGGAALRLEATTSDGWTPLVDIRLCEVVPVSQSLLRLSPRRAGRGIAPLGFLQGIRTVVYPVSQVARSLRCRERRA